MIIAKHELWTDVTLPIVGESAAAKVLRQSWGQEKAGGAAKLIVVCAF